LPFLGVLAKGSLGYPKGYFSTIQTPKRIPIIIENFEKLKFFGLV